MDGYPRFSEKCTGVPWRGMRGMRNRITHDYFDINLDVVWETVQTALPQLLKQLSDARSDAQYFDQCEEGRMTP